MACKGRQANADLTPTVAGTDSCAASTAEPVGMPASRRAARCRPTAEVIARKRLSNRSGRANNVPRTPGRRCRRTLPSTAL